MSVCKFYIITTWNAGVDVTIDPLLSLKTVIFFYICIVQVIYLRRFERALAVNVVLVNVLSQVLSAFLITLSFYLVVEPFIKMVTLNVEISSLKELIEYRLLTEFTSFITLVLSSLMEIVRDKSNTKGNLLSHILSVLVFITLELSS